MSTDPHVSDLLLQWEELAEQGQPIALEELCHDCPHLLDELRGRVRALQNINSLLHPGALPPVADGTVEHSPSQAALTRPGKDRPDRPAFPLPCIAGYEILRELGRGGMGVVYLARQQRLNRLVALKMILADTYASEQQRQRFKAEAEVIARLQHPHIVQIYEVGEVGGRPYCVLEFVAGGSLAEALDGKPLPPRPAAQLLATLADAVQAAHGQGIIHRDLKPGNVLLQRGVTADGEGTYCSAEPGAVGWEGEAPAEPGAVGSAGPPARQEPRPPDPLPARQEPRPPDPLPARQEARPPDLPKITDFGLAKQLEGDSGLTETNAVLGTPSYMAPEQAAGRSQQVGPAADLYSLGAILYEVLTGRPPLLGSTALETLQMVLNHDPLPPRRLQPHVPRDLETICLRCLHKDPARRYASASDLADELRRFLRGEAIRARATPTWERTVKWARRRPAAAALVVVSVLAVLLMVGGSLAWNTQLRHQRDEADRHRLRAERNEALALKEKELAEANFQLARRVVDGYSATLTKADHLRPEVLRKELLRLTLTWYQQFVERRGDDTALLAANGWSYLRFGQLTGELGFKEATAIDLYKKALSLFEQVQQRNPTDPNARRDVALACYHLGRTWWEISNLKEAESILGRALTMQRQLLKQNPASAPDRRNLARTCSDLGRVYCILKRKPSEIEAFFQEGLTLLDQLQKQQALEPADIEARGYLLERLGDHYVLQHQNGPARAAFTQALEVRKQLTENQPGISSYMSGLARGYWKMGQICYAVGERKAALRFHQQARQIREELARDHPDVVQYALELGMSYQAFANQSNKQEERADWNAKAIKVLQSILATEPRHIEVRNILGLAYVARVLALNKLKRYEEALSEWRRAEEHRLALGPISQSHHIETLSRLERHDEAMALVATLPVERLQPQQLINLARVCARSAKAAQANPELPPPHQKRLVDQSARRAISLLSLAKKAGRFAGANAREKIRQDPDFEILAKRKDFQQLVAPPK